MGLLYRASRWRLTAATVLLIICCGLVRSDSTPDRETGNERRLRRPYPLSRLPAAATGETDVTDTLPTEAPGSETEAIEASSSAPVPVPVPDPAPAPAPTIEVGGFVDPNEDDACRFELDAADIDNDQRLVPFEYSLFLKLASGGAVDKPFAELRAIFVLIYYSAACTYCYEATGDENCCVGSKAAVDLGSAAPVDFVCRNTAIAIEEILKPTLAPATTLAPSTVSPTRSPVAPTDAPSQAPAETASPTISPSTARPTISPSTATPTISPSTATPTISPSTATPTISPSTATPTISPTTATPTISPTTASPTISPTTASPTDSPDELLCVDFAYTVRNSVGLSASDIFNEVNNTVKAGLIAATNEVVKNTLNQTFPEPVVLGAEMLSRTKRFGEQRRLEGVDRAVELAIVDLLGKDTASEIMAAYQENILDEAPGYLFDGRLLLHSRRRHLVFYSDEYPATINAILDEPFCLPNQPLILCALVSSQACVVLEEGDDANFIRMVLLEGLRDAINDGFTNLFPSSSIP